MAPQGIHHRTRRHLVVLRLQVVRPEVLGLLDVAIGIHDLLGRHGFAPFRISGRPTTRPLRLLARSRRREQCQLFGAIVTCTAASPGTLPACVSIACAASASGKVWVWSFSSGNRPDSMIRIAWR